MEAKKNIKISCFGTLNVIIFLVFFIAKIFDKIDWSWWWVFSPLWIPLVILLLVIILIVLTLISNIR